MQLAEQTVLIGGGATGIGKATALHLAAQGAQVVIGDHKLEPAQACAEEILSRGGQAKAIAYDQSEEQSIVELVAKTLEQQGRLNSVFANVADIGAIMEDSDMVSIDIEIWRRTMDTNITGTHILLRETIPHLLAQNGGSIVCTSSGASNVGENQRPAYAASKAAINAMCRHVASKWGSRGIRCNSIAPGFIVTEQIQNNYGDEQLEKMLKGYRSERHGQPEDIAAGVAFLMSDEGSWINGQVWHINGGACYGL